MPLSQSQCQQVLKEQQEQFNYQIDLQTDQLIHERKQSFQSITNSNNIQYQNQYISRSSSKSISRLEKQKQAIYEKFSKTYCSKLHVPGDLTILKKKIGQQRSITTQNKLSITASTIQNHQKNKFSSTRYQMYVKKHQPISLKVKKKISAPLGQIRKDPQNLLEGVEKIQQFSKQYRDQQKQIIQGKKDHRKIKNQYNSNESFLYKQNSKLSQRITKLHKHLDEYQIKNDKQQKQQKLESKAIFATNILENSKKKEKKLDFFIHDRFKQYPKKNSVDKKQIQPNFIKDLIKKRNIKKQQKKIFLGKLQIEEKSFPDIRPKTVNNDYNSIKIKQQGKNVKRKQTLGIQKPQYNTIKSLNNQEKVIRTISKNSRQILMSRQQSDQIVEDIDILIHPISNRIKSNIKSPDSPIKNISQSKILRLRNSQLHNNKKNINANPSTILKKTPENGPLFTNTFIFDSKDHPYIVSYLKGKNWNCIRNRNFQYFQLKWVNNPVPSDIINLKSNQFYNHFGKSHQLTSKSYLNANLKANKYQFRTDRFFPECFDIGNQVECEEFISIFKFNILMKLLEKIIFYLSDKCSQLITEELQNYIYLYQAEELAYDDHEIDSVLQKQNGFNAIEFEDYKQRNSDCMLQMNLIVQLLKFLRKERKKYDIQFIESKFHFLNWDEKQFETNYSALYTYSELDNIGCPRPEKGLYKQYFATPSKFLIKALSRQYAFFSKNYKWNHNYKKKVLNNPNIWIVKPSSNARGNGIYLETDLESIVRSAKGIQSRIVQKYICDPLLLTKTPNSYINHHKFDFRQWVLLKSINPLQIYMFSQFYLRLASEQYSLSSESMKNQKIHLTNFSTNKKHYKNIEHQSIVSSEVFEKFFLEEHKINFKQEILPKIKQIIIKSILSCQDKLEVSTNGHCFELLGYDILLDQHMNPWLLQVNMSPACEQRIDWLSQYLKNMNQGLLDIILPTQNLSYNLGEEKKYKWTKIYEENYHFNGKDFDPLIEIVSNNFFTQNKLARQKNESRAKSNIQVSVSPKKKALKKKSSHNMSAKKQRQEIGQLCNDSIFQLDPCQLSNLNQGYEQIASPKSVQFSNIALQKSSIQEISPNIQQNNNSNNDIIDKEGTLMTS